MMGFTPEELSTVIETWTKLVRQLPRPCHEFVGRREYVEGRQFICTQRREYNKRESSYYWEFAHGYEWTGLGIVWPESFWDAPEQAVGVAP